MANISTMRDPVDPSTDGQRLPPYLTLVDRLSLSWLSTPIIALLFVITTLVVTRGNLQDATADMKTGALSRCQAAETAATVAGSLPRYMAEAVNRGIAAAVDDTISAAKDVLILALTALEGTMSFSIKGVSNAELCFYQLLLDAGLTLIIDAVDEVSTFLNTTLHTIAADIEQDVLPIETSVNGLIAQAHNILPELIPDAPINFPNISNYLDFQIPTTFEDDLRRVNGSLPSVNDLTDLANEVIHSPIEALKSLINTTFSGLHFDEHVLTLPPQQHVTFCNATDLTSPIDDLGATLVKIPLITIGIVVGFMVLLIGANCVWQWHRWHALSTRATFIERGFPGVDSRTPISPTSPSPLLASSRPTLSLLAEGHHPVIFQFLDTPLMRRIFQTRVERDTAGWFLAFVTYPPALMCLFIGAAGILAVELQFALVNAYTGDANAQFSNIQTDLSPAINTAITDAMISQTGVYVDAINSHITDIQNTVDDNLFGWINRTTLLLNNTITTLYTDVIGIIDDVANIGGLDLGPPVNRYIGCMTGDVQSIQDALTWINEVVNVRLPLLDPDILLLSNASLGEITGSIADATMGRLGANATPGAGNDTSADTGNQLIDKYTNTLNAERWLFGIFFALWGVVVLLGIIMLIWHTCGRQPFYTYERGRWKAQHAQMGEDEAMEIQPLEVKTTGEEKVKDHVEEDMSGVGTLGYLAVERHSTEEKSEEWGWTDKASVSEVSVPSTSARRAYRPLPLTPMVSISRQASTHREVW